MNIIEIQVRKFWKELTYSFKMRPYLILHFVTCDRFSQITSYIMLPHIFKHMLLLTILNQPNALFHSGTVLYWNYIWPINWGTASLTILNTYVVWSSLSGTVFILLINSMHHCHNYILQKTPLKLTNGSKKWAVEGCHKQ